MNQNILHRDSDIDTHPRQRAGIGHVLIDACYCWISEMKTNITITEISPLSASVLLSEKVYKYSIFEGYQSCTIFASQGKYCWDTDACGGLVFLIQGPYIHEWVPYIKKPQKTLLILHSRGGWEHTAFGSGSSM